MMRLFIGYDERETLQYCVAAQSAREHALSPIRIEPVWLTQLRIQGLYRRPTLCKPGGNQLIDAISDAPMSTAFAISRFFVPLISGAQSGLVAFVDCDVMFRKSVARLFEAHRRGKAVSVVQHDYHPPAMRKMDGQVQTAYPRKNWSSVMVFDLAHPKIRALSADYLNRATGLELHSFAWLDNDDIGALPEEWNYLVGHSRHPDPALIHWTEGAPCTQGYEDAEYADQFWRTLGRALK
jgi:hypothetical protein